MGRYSRIKSQTNVAITWLIETAFEHGSNVQVSGDTNSRASAAATPTSTSIKTGRLKGKARKEAKKKEQLQSQAPAPKIKASNTIYKVSTEEILRQARYLKNLDQELVMSKPAWNAFKEAVRGRTEYATKFANKQPDHEGNAGHVYFLDTLRQVVDMIGNVVRVQETSLDNSAKRQDTDLTSHNLFDVLRDVELTDGVQGTANLTTPPDEGLAYGAAAAVPSARYEPAIDSDEESRLRWLCFKDDADSITSWVINLWKQYFDQSEEGVSLETTSLLSDLALDLLYKIEDDMEHNNDKVNEAMFKELASLYNWSSTALALFDFRVAAYEGRGYPAVVKLVHKRQPQLGLDPYKDFILFDAKFVRYLTELQLEMYLDLSVARKEQLIRSCVSIPDLAGTAEARLQFGEEHIIPSEDQDFLRKNNPLTPAKLALNLQFLRAEIGFDFANDDRSLFLMCHLYNALRQLGYLEVPWKTLDSLIDMHMKTIFLGALPTESAKQMSNRVLIALGCAPELVRARNTGKGREATIKNLAVLREKRSGALCFPPSMAIVADHLHDREPLRRTLTRLDAEMVAKHSRESKNSRIKSFLDEENPTTVLERLRNHVSDFPRYLALDCVELTRICGGLLKRFRSDEMKVLMKHAELDAAHQQYVALLIIQELDMEEYMTRPGMPVRKFAHAIEAAAILKEYIEGGEDARAAVQDYVQRR
ncbi:uncharacterized protein J4E84_009370 [Alternaria hordeiaustralica]|uniref:uncharacterized protein n=1 Tax=Alternaria hordeiaustralica TaxID=1187925 RepID=UPI0020C256DC|nr:uncharacterized protein J4E84_009370 [Alternaria hordeiaustralica]KAI4676776.1 hypothetical protein J4E84_009370 [Alternaria hordeiaustralica]